jgi:hypothetical protein
MAQKTSIGVPNGVKVRDEGTFDGLNAHRVYGVWGGFGFA